MFLRLHKIDNTQLHVHLSCYIQKVYWLDSRLFQEYITAFFTKSGTKNITFKITIWNHNLTSNIKKVKGNATYNINIEIYLISTKLTTKNKIIIKKKSINSESPVYEYLPLFVKKRCEKPCYLNKNPAIFSSLNFGKSSLYVFSIGMYLNT